MIDCSVREAVRALQTPPEYRSSSQIDMLYRSIAHLRFFSELRRKFRTDKVARDLCKLLTMIKLSQGQTLDTQQFTGPIVGVVLEGKASKRVDQKHRRGDADTEENVTILSQGEYFGQIFEKRGAAILVEALEPCSLMCILIDNYIEVLSLYETQRTQDLMAFVSSIPTFNNWTKSSVLKLINCFEVRTYLRNQVVYQEGDKATEVYMIKRGEFKFTKLAKTTSVAVPNLAGLYGPRSSNKELSVLRNVLHRPSTSVVRKVEIAILGVKEIFGEDEIMEDKRRHATCVCISADSELIIVSKADFMRRMSHPVTLELLKGRNKCLQTFHNKNFNTFVKSRADLHTRSAISSPSSMSPDTRSPSKSASHVLTKKVPLAFCDKSHTTSRASTAIKSESMVRPLSGTTKNTSLKLRKAVLVPRLVVRHQRVRSC